MDEARGENAVRNVVSAVLLALVVATAGACATLNDLLGKDGSKDPAAVVEFSTFGERGNVGQWVVTDEKDAFTDSTFCKIGSLGANQKGFVTIVLRDSELKAVVGFERLMSSEDSTSVRHRFDSETPEDNQWSVSTDKKAVFAPDPDAFLAQLRAANKLAVQATTVSGNPMTLIFEFADNAEAFAAFDACREPS